MKDNLILIVNEKGKLETAPIGMLKANANYTSTITVITPMPLDNVVMANFNKRNSVDWNVSQFLIPSGRKKGKDILDKTHDLYHKVYDWNVFEGIIDSKAVAYFAKYRADLLYVSIGVGSQQTPALAENYKGIFNFNKPLPETAENGDYYISNGYNFNDKNIKWTLNDIAYYWNGWKKSNYIGTFNTTSVAVPVDPNIPTNIEVVADQDLAVLLAGKIATIEEDIVNLDILTQEHRIRIGNLENDNEVNKTDIADLKLKDQEQDQRLDNIETDIDNITESIKIDNDTLVRENETIKVSDKLTNQININKNDIANNAAEIQSVKDTTYTKTQSDNKFATIQAMDLQLQEKLNVKPDGTNPLVIGNKLNSTYIDSLYITDVFVVENKSELTTLTAQRGDIAIVENESKTYVLKSGSPATLSNWVELLFPVSVVSVNGKTGAVILGISDIPELESTLNSKLAVNIFENFKGEVEVDYAKKTDLTSHIENSVVHITQAERTAWNNKQDKLGVAGEDLGLVKAVKKSEEHTEQVAIDEEGYLWVKPSAAEVIFEERELLSDSNIISLPANTSSKPIYVEMYANDLNKARPIITQSVDSSGNVSLNTSSNYYVNFNVLDGVWEVNKPDDKVTYQPKIKIQDLESKQYRVRFDVLSGSLSEKIYVNFTDGGTSTTSVILGETLRTTHIGNGFEFNISADEAPLIKDITFNISGRKIVNNLKFRVQIEEGNTFTNYEVPYVLPQPTRQRLSLNGSSIVINEGDTSNTQVVLPNSPLLHDGTNYTLDGVVIPVSGGLAGEGNLDLTIKPADNKVYSPVVYKVKYYVQINVGGGGVEKPEYDTEKSYFESDSNVIILPANTAPKPIYVEMFPETKNKLQFKNNYNTDDNGIAILETLNQNDYIKYDTQKGIFLINKETTTSTFNGTYLTHKLPKKEHTVSLEILDGELSHSIYFGLFNGSPSSSSEVKSITIYTNDVGKKIQFNLTAEESSLFDRFKINISNGKTLNNFKMTLQFEEGNEATDFEIPYAIAQPSFQKVKLNKEVVNINYNNISTSNKIEINNSIIVEDGEYFLNNIPLETQGEVFGESFGKLVIMAGDGNKYSPLKYRVHYYKYNEGGLANIPDNLLDKVNLIELEGDENKYLSADGSYKEIKTNITLDDLLGYTQPKFIKDRLHEVERQLLSSPHFKFAFMTDTHANDLQKNVQFKEMNYLNRRGMLDFMAHGGDLINHGEKEELLNVIDGIVKAMKEDAKAPVFVCRGNHENNFTMWNSATTEEERLKTVITPVEWANIAVNHLGESIVKDQENVNGGYYYYDFNNHKIRVIVLNTADMYDEDNDYYPYWQSFGNNDVRQKQFDWFAHKALNFMDKGDDRFGWGVIILSHANILGGPWGSIVSANHDGSTNHGNNLHSFRNTLKAFRDGTSYKGTTSPDSPFRLDVDVDFTEQGEMEFICSINGHGHIDQVFRTDDGITSVQVITSSPARRRTQPPATGSIYEVVSPYRGELEGPDRVTLPYPTNELINDGWDVFEIDRENKTIKTTRIGAGVNRVFKYDDR